MSEIEILRGAKVRVTTETAQVGNHLTPISQITSAAFVEADHKVRLVPKILLIIGPIIGGAVYLALSHFLYGALAGVLIMTIGAILYSNSWLHHVTAHLTDGATKTLFRTSRKGDALLFHAAIEKALKMRGGSELGG